MDEAERLVTCIDVDPGQGASPVDQRQMSITALHHLELTSGRRVVLLDDRGWSTAGPPDTWAHVSLEDVAETARTVVGPDEPARGHSHEEMTAAHWAHLAATAAQQGVHIEPGVLAALEHQVEISQDIRARLAPSTK